MSRCARLTGLSDAATGRRGAPGGAAGRHFFGTGVIDGGLRVESGSLSASFGCPAMAAVA